MKLKIMGMKKILLAVFSVICVSAFGQTPPTYTKISNKYAWLGGAFDSTLRFPVYSITPVGLRGGVPNIAGQVGIDTVLHGAYFYSGQQWRPFGTTIIPISPITASGTGTVTISTLVPATSLVGRYDGSAGVMQSVKLGTNLSFSNDTLNATETFTGTLTDVTATDNNGFDFTITGTTIKNIALATSVTNNYVLRPVSGALTGDADFQFDGQKISHYANNLGVTQSDNNGFLLENTQAATSGNQQISPSIHWSGKGWGGSNQSVDFRSYVLPVQGGSNPTGNWKLQQSINGGAYSDVIAFGSSGEIFTGAGSAGTANQALLSGGAGAAFTWGTVDLSASNELQTIAVTGTTTGITTLSNSGGSMTIAGAGINTVGVAGSTITITGTEVDGSTSNELQTLSGSGTTTPIITLSNSGGNFSITGAGIAAASRSGTDITITATEVDGSTSNELQTLANTSNSTTHTVTLSNSGGSIQLVEGSGITLTTTGTSADGVVTIASSGGVTPAALTKTDDSNVTLTLGGTPSTALLQATSLTLGWTGDLPFSRFVQGGANTVITNPTTGTADFTTTALGASELLGRGSSGNIAPITMGTGISLVGTVLTPDDNSATNEIQTLSGSGTTNPIITLSGGGGTFSLVGAGISVLSRSGTDITITSTEVDGSTSNELQTLSTSGTSTPTVTLSNSGGSFSITGAGIAVLSRTGDAFTVTATEVDGSTSNELQTISLSGTTTVTNTLSNSGGAWTLTGAGIAAVSRSGNDVTVTATEADGSTSNELQTIANTSDATSHTATLSIGGGSIQLIEGSGVTLTTGGTSSDGTVTISASGSSITADNGVNMSTATNVQLGGALVVNTLIDGDQFDLTLSDIDALSLTANSISSEGSLFETADITPAQITSNQNDYNPTGLATAAYVRINSNAARDITGLAGGSDGRKITLVNTGSNAITLKDESGSSTAANRFKLGSDEVLGAGKSIDLWYDDTDDRWRVINGVRISPVDANGFDFTLGSGNSFTLTTTVSNTQLFYSNSGAVAGVSGATSDGTNVTFGTENLRATSPRITTGIDDSNGNTAIGITATSSAVNYVNITNEATTSHPKISVAGTDSDIALKFQAKGTGWFELLSTSSGPAKLIFNETSNAGNFVAWQAPGSFSVNQTYTYPTDYPAANTGYYFTSDMSGNTSWGQIPTISSGTYTPTITAVSNASNVSASSCQYLRVGNTVTVSGKISYDFTTGNSTTRVGISLPIASNFSANNECAGTSGHPDYLSHMVISADSSNDRAEVNSLSPNTEAGGGTWFIHFTYRII